MRLEHGVRRKVCVTHIFSAHGDREVGQLWFLSDPYEQTTSHFENMEVNNIF